MGTADRVVSLDFGQVVAEGAPEEVRNNLRVIESYLGSSASVEKEAPIGTIPLDSASNVRP
jgi:hypothetical protein